MLLKSSDLNCQHEFTFKSSGLEESWQRLHGKPQRRLGDLLKKNSLGAEIKSISDCIEYVLIQYCRERQFINFKQILLESSQILFLVVLVYSPQGQN